MYKLIMVVILGLSVVGCGKDTIELDANDWQCAGAHRVAEGVDECNMYIKKSAWRR